MTGAAPKDPAFIALERIMQPDCVDLIEGGVPCPICSAGTLTWLRMREHGACWVSCTNDACVYFRVNTGTKYEVRN